MPWLTGTALLHSIQVQEKRGTLKTWNVGLALGTGILAVLGTFLVRSGILDSIHAFGASTLGGPFLAFIGVLLVGSVVLVASRRDTLRSEGRLDSLLSRETAFLANNLVLVGLCFVILWGTFFPLISEAITGTKQSVGPSWFDRYTTPLAIALVILSGMGPALAWGRTTPGRLAGIFRVPAGAAAVTLVSLVAAGAATRHPFAVAMFCAAAFAVACVAQELWHAARARQALTSERTAVTVVELVRRNRRRYGGYLVHVGMAVLFVGVAASSAFQHARDVRLAPGQSTRVGGYDVRYAGPTSSLSPEKISLGAVLDVSRDGRRVTTLAPSRTYYASLDDRSLGRIGRFFNGESTSELGLKAGPTRDIWTAIQPDLTSVEGYIRNADRRFPDANSALEGFLVSTIVTRYLRKPPPAQFRVIVSPLVGWIWIGGTIVIAGAMVAIWPSRRRRVASAAAGPRARARVRLRGPEAAPGAAARSPGRTPSARRATADPDRARRGRSRARRRACSACSARTALAGSRPAGRRGTP
jgi:cytochrome c-type biogenesis protein CcmF